MPRRISDNLIKKIKRFRQKGYSLPEIKQKVNTVGYGSIYRYVKDVEILPLYKNQWFGKRGGSRKRQMLAENKAIEKAKDVIDNVSDKELLIFISALYWGEGSKADFGLLNSDSQLIKVFVKALRRLFRINNDRLRVSVRIYEDLDCRKCLNYWSKITGVPIKEFARTDILQGKKSGKLPYGLCRIRVIKGGDLLKYLKAVKSVVTDKICSRSSTDRAEVS